jgi:hypothetical protein
MVQRLTGFTLIAAVAALAVSGCGAKDAVDPVAQAAQVTDQQRGGIAMMLSGKVSDGSQAMPITGSGTVDRGGRKGTFSLELQAQGQSVTVDEVLDGRVLYLRTDQFKGKLPGGKDWLKIDLEAAARTQGVNVDAIMPQGPSQDPAQMLEYLKGAGTSKELGKRTIRGVETSGYHVDVDLRKAAQKAGGADARKAIDQAIKQIGRSTIPVDVWVDKDHLVRRERVNFDIAANGKTASIDLTIDMTKYNVPVTADAPAEKDTVDALKLLSSSQGG